MASGRTSRSVASSSRRTSRRPSAPSLFAASGAEEEFALPGVVRWVRDRGMGVQFGLLGVQETHAITELEKSQ
jgi:hypothetical protein